MGPGIFVTDDWFLSYLPSLNRRRDTSRLEIWRALKWGWVCRHQAEGLESVWGLGLSGSGFTFLGNGPSWGRCINHGIALEHYEN